ncbi:methyl-coenzyme M reductase I operon protein C [Methanobrevibacter ruminantium]|uniref:methyl-coenzyme M reductase I operon protein C n=1 Tax=Methanobrevibacter ruminantium TaxID=83816 RepID=UPI0026F09564|nr:methyl-coenzyme M reductase I operon protein C [Methanobrevibacter ruminantium]
MIGRCTHIVDCRETRGLGEGGGIAQRGTFAECGSDVLAVAMSPGRRHITKPVCEITFGLREANLLTSTMILDAGSGVPHDAPAGGAGNAFGLTDKEVEQMQKFKIIVVHLGGVRNHITYKARLILRNVNKPCVIICEYPVDFEDFAKIGVKTAKVMPEEVKTEGKIMNIVSGVIRGQTVSQEKLDEIIRKVRLTLGDA